MSLSVCEIRFAGGFDAASERGPIRWELFLHGEVRDVLLTPRPDTLRIVHRGLAAPDEWSATLREAGFPEPAFTVSERVDGEHTLLDAA